MNLTEKQEVVKILKAIAERKNRETDKISIQRADKIKNDFGKTNKFISFAKEYKNLRIAKEKAEKEMDRFAERIKKENKKSLYCGINLPNYYRDKNLSISGYSFEIKKELLEKIRDKLDSLILKVYSSDDKEINNILNELKKFRI